MADTPESLLLSVDSVPSAQDRATDSLDDNDGND
jgi:hypothetical protein